MKFNLGGYDAEEFTKGWTTFAKAWRQSEKGPKGTLKDRIQVPLSHQSTTTKLGESH